MKAIAFWHEPTRVRRHAEAFAAGCRRHGVACDVRCSHEAGAPEPGVDVIWHYGLGDGGQPFLAYAGRALRVGGDAGVWRRLTTAVYVRVSVEGQQLGALLNARRHDYARFEAMGVRLPVAQRRGDYILVTGSSVHNAEMNGRQYGDWERETCERLQRITRRTIVLREKPKHPSIDIAGVRSDRSIDAYPSIAGAWAVVCRSGNIAADAILLNVPVWAEQGTGAVYRNFELEEIDSAQPLSPEGRRRALADVAAWQFTDGEIERGELWDHLVQERLL